MSNTRVFQRGSLLPPLWLFIVPGLVVDGVVLDTPCWIAAPDDVSADKQLKMRHQLKRIPYDTRDRKMRVATLHPTTEPPLPAEVALGVEP